MIAVTVVAGRRRQVVLLGERRVVHAAPVIGQLGGGKRLAVRQRVSLHVVGRGVARAAGGGHIGRKGRRLRVVDEPDAVRAVAADAGGHAGIAGGQSLAVYARRIFGGLIHALARRELVHEFGVAVAARADGDDLRARRPSAIAACGVVGGSFVCRGRIAAVAIDAGKPVLVVDVARKRFGRRRKLLLRQGRMARQALIDRLGGRLRRCGASPQQADAGGDGRQDQARAVCDGHEAKCPMMVNAIR